MHVYILSVSENSQVKEDDGIEWNLSLRSSNLQIKCSTTGPSGHASRGCLLVINLLTSSLSSAIGIRGQLWLSRNAHWICLHTLEGPSRYGQLFSCHFHFTMSPKSCCLYKPPEKTQCTVLAFLSFFYSLI